MSLTGLRKEMKEDAYKAGVEGFEKVLKDFTDGFARIDRLNQPEVLVRCCNCKSEQRVSKLAIKERIIKCRCGGFCIAVKYEKE